jgi:hypothetical protein
MIKDGTIIGGIGYGAGQKLTGRAPYVWALSVNLLLSCFITNLKSLSVTWEALGMA